MDRMRIIASALVAAFVLAEAGPVLAGNNGVIKGKIIFKGDADGKDYKRSVIDTSKDPNCAKSKKKIGSESVILNKKTDPSTIRNVLVSVKEGASNGPYPVPEKPFELTQVGCQYQPHVLAMRAGQPLRIINGDDTNHNIHFLPKTNQEINFTQPKKGMEKDVTLVTEKVFKIKCDVHPWMGAYIAVFDHPFFDVTGKEGTYELSGLPAGTYVIEAWHEEFGAQTTTVELAVDETKEQDFTFEPGK